MPNAYKICLTVWKDKYDCEQAWTRLQQISEMTEVKKQEDKDTEEEIKSLTMRNKTLLPMRKKIPMKSPETEMEKAIEIAQIQKRPKNISTKKMATKQRK